MDKKDIKRLKEIYNHVHETKEEPTPEKSQAPVSETFDEKTNVEVLAHRIKKIEEKIAMLSNEITELKSATTSCNCQCDEIDENDEAFSNLLLNEIFSILFE